MSRGRMLISTTPLILFDSIREDEFNFSPFTVLRRGVWFGVSLMPASSAVLEARKEKLPLENETSSSVCV